jgi:hypothetical protein
MWWYVLIGGAIAVWLVLMWAKASVRRGGRVRDRKILKMLDPVGRRLAQGEPVSRAEVAQLAAMPHTRRMLYGLLKHFERLDLFPAELRDARTQAEAALAYWLLHPNEFQDVPAEMALVERVAREVDGEAVAFYVFRFRMGEGHWAANSGWLLGLAGPFIRRDVPYANPAGAFARGGDRFGETSPEELVDWFIGMVRRKSGQRV